MFKIKWYTTLFCITIIPLHQIFSPNFLENLLAPVGGGPPPPVDPGPTVGARAGFTPGGGTAATPDAAAADAGCDATGGMGGPCPDISLSEGGGGGGPLSTSSPSSSVFTHRFLAGSHSIWNKGQRSLHSCQHVCVKMTNHYVGNYKWQVVLQRTTEFIYYRNYYFYEPTTVKSHAEITKNY